MAINNGGFDGGGYGGGTAPDPSAGAGASSAGSSAPSAAAAAVGGGGPIGGTIYDEFAQGCTIAINTPTRVQDYRVPPGYRVEVWPEPGNATAFKVARIPSATIGGPFSSFAAGSSGRAFPGIRNTSELWLNFGTITDKAIIRIVS